MYSTSSPSSTSRQASLTSTSAQDPLPSSMVASTTSLHVGTPGRDGRRKHSASAFLAPMPGSGARARTEPAGPNSPAARPQVAARPPNLPAAGPQIAPRGPQFYPPRGRQRGCRNPKINDNVIRAKAMRQKLRGIAPLEEEEEELRVLCSSAQTGPKTSRGAIRPTHSPLCWRVYYTSATGYWLGDVLLMPTMISLVATPSHTCTRARAHTHTRKSVAIPPNLYLAVTSNVWLGVGLHGGRVTQYVYVQL